MEQTYSSWLPRWLPRPLAALGLLLATASAAQAQTPTFASAVAYSTGAGSTPFAIGVADVNADGRPDLLTANNRSNTVSVLLGNGNGTFQAVAAYGTGSTGPYDVVAADVNADGRPDLLLVASGSSQASVLLGNGNGTFQTAVTYGTGGTGPSGLTVADVNGDGKPDLLAANANSTSLGVLLGNGDGTFQTATAYGTVGTQPYDVVALDVNADGRPDLLTANFASNSASVLLGNGNGTFQAATTYSTGASSGPTRLAVADVNADGRPDLLTANYSSASVGVLLGTGTGTFQAVVTYSTGGNQSYSLAVGDLNGDGRLDLATANQTSGTVGVLVGNGNGTFQTAATYGAGGSDPVGMAIADVNADSKPDLLVANLGNSVGVLLNTTVYAAPTLTRISPNPAPVGTSVTLTGTNLTGATGVRFNGTAATTFAVVNATTFTATVPTGATTGPVTVTTPGGTSNGVAFTVVPTITWTGAVSNTYPDPRNWDLGRAPSSTDNVVIPPTTRQPVLSPALGIGSAGNLLIQAGASLTLNSQSELDLFGNLTNNGTFGGPGLLSVRTTGTGPVTHTLGGSGSTITPGDLELVANAPTTLTLPVRLSRSLVLAADLTTTAAGSLTLLSTPTATAFVVNSGGVVVGPATVQRAIDPSLNPGAGYRHYSAPVSNSTVADLTTPGFTPTVNPAYNTSATPTFVRPFPTVYGYDDSRLSLANNLPAFDKGYFSPAALSDPLAVGRGYSVNISASEVVDFQGTLNNGPLTLPLISSRNTYPDGGWQLLGNPYPAPLDYSRVAAADRLGLESAIYVYSSTSQYQGRYRTYVNGIGNPVLPVGQAFFARVAASVSTATMTFRNSQRLTAPDATPFQRTAADPRPLVQLTLQGAGAALADEAYVYFEQGATTGFEPAFDAEKLVNPTGLNLSTTQAGHQLSIDGQPELGTSQRVVPLAVGVPTAGVYTFTASQLLNLGATPVYLRDLQLGTLTDLRQQPTYQFTVANVAALSTSRFELVFSPQQVLAAVPAALAQQVALYPNPATTQLTLELPATLARTAVTATLVDALGRLVRTQVLPAGLATHTLPLADLAAGVYAVRLSTEAGMIVKKLVIE